ncbi:MAG TPA: hypothetical protein VG605_18780 [Puia sp.]|nr:hypothetical protein [Puia sp.]
MKKLFFSIVAVLMMSAGAFAAKNDDGVANPQAVRALKKDFVNARNIVWETRDNFAKATFSLDGQILFAYYNNNGDLQAVVRNILSDQLPINLLTSLRNDYAGSWITDLFEMASDDQTTYYVTLETSDKKIVLRSQGANSWEVYSKGKK